MSANSNREPSKNVIVPPRRAKTETEDALPPRFSRVNEAIQLVAPDDCDASAILKVIGQNSSGGDAYAFWLVVGRNGNDAPKVSYQPASGDIRCDIPSGASMSAEALVPQLAQFLKPASLNGGAQPAEGPAPTLRP
jgi:hypothetical protein